MMVTIDWRSIVAALAVTMLGSCTPPGIVYEYIDDNGNPVRFSMNGDLGLATGEGIVDNNDVNLPIIGNLVDPGGGGVDQSRTITQVETMVPPSLRLPDGFEIAGTYSSTALVRERWTGLRGTLKSVAATVMWWKTVDEMGTTIRNRDNVDANKSITNNRTDASVTKATVAETEKTKRILSRE